MVLAWLNHWDRRGSRAGCSACGPLGRGLAQIPKGRLQPAVCNGLVYQPFSTWVLAEEPEEVFEVEEAKEAYED